MKSVRKCTTNCFLSAETFCQGRGAGVKQGCASVCPASSLPRSVEAGEGREQQGSGSPCQFPSGHCQFRKIPAVTLASNLAALGGRVRLQQQLQTIRTTPCCLDDDTKLGLDSMTRAVIVVRSKRFTIAYKRSKTNNPTTEHTFGAFHVL